MTKCWYKASAGAGRLKDNALCRSLLKPFDKCFVAALVVGETSAHAIAQAMSDVIRDNRRRDCYRVFNLGNKRRLDWSFRIFCWRRMQLFLSGSRYLDRCELFTETWLRPRRGRDRRPSDRDVVDLLGRFFGIAVRRRDLASAGNGEPWLHEPKGYGYTRKLGASWTSAAATSSCARFSSASPPISQGRCRGSLSKGTRSARAAVARAASSVASGAPSRRASSRYAAS